MTSRDFCYWLQGYFELSGIGDNSLLAGKQLEQVKNHLAMVFKHEIDPSFGSKDHQLELARAHAGLSDQPSGGVVVAKGSLGELLKGGTDGRINC